MIFLTNPKLKIRKRPMRNEFFVECMLTNGDLLRMKVGPKFFETADRKVKAKQIAYARRESSGS